MSSGLGRIVLVVSEGCHYIIRDLKFGFLRHCGVRRGGELNGDRTAVFWIPGALQKYQIGSIAGLWNENAITYCIEKLDDVMLHLIETNLSDLNATQRR